MVKAQDPTRCPQCSMLARLCICALVPRLETATRLVLILNHREKRKPTNTGTLAARCLINSETHVLGEKDAPLDVSLTVAASSTNLVLFPTEQSIPLTAEVCRDLHHPIRLIVPDGDWSQAARIRRKLPEGSLTYVTLPEGPPSQYGLRRIARGIPDGLSTLEAIARALHVMEGPHISEPLLHVFRIFVERTLWSRGKLPASQVYGGLPPE